MKIKSKLLTSGLLALICVSTEGFAQSYIRISGLVEDNNGSPVPYAHIAIKGRNMGGTTDLKGEFKYYINEDYQLDTLAISFVGYQTMEVPVNAIVNSPNQKFTLKENIVELAGVTVYAPQKILQQALEPFKAAYDSSLYYVRKGIITTTRLENDDHSIFEETFFNLHYRGRDDGEIIGFEPLAHRRSFDFARFPLVNAKGGRRSFGGAYFFGNNMLYQLGAFLKTVDTLSLQVSDITMVGNEKAYVISRILPSGASTNFYVSINDSKLLKVRNRFSRSQVSTFMGGSPFSSSQFNRFLYQFTGTYFFERRNGQVQLSGVKHERHTQFIEKITGHVIKNYHEVHNVKFYDIEPLAERPKKFKDEFSIPLKVKYDKTYWTNISEEHNHKLLVDISEQLNRGVTLLDQFEQSNGQVVRVSAEKSTRFGKRDQKLQAEVSDVDRFIEELKSNNYQADYAPDLSWEDIPELMAIASSNQIIDRMPRNIMSRIYVDECYLGIVALWLIDSIRKSEGRRPRKAWYVSPVPILEDAADRNKSKERGQGNTFLASNSEDKLDKAYAAFAHWWQSAGNISRNKAKRINPFAESDINWLWR